MAQALLDAEKAEAIIAKLRADKLLLVAQLAAMRTRAEEAEAALRAGGMGMGMRERAERAEATCITLQEELDARPPRAADGCSLCCGPDRNVLVIDRRELLSLTLTLTPTLILSPTLTLTLILTPTPTLTTHPHPNQARAAFLGGRGARAVRMLHAQ